MPDRPGRRPNRTNPTGRINGWKSILAITYGDLNIN